MTDSGCWPAAAELLPTDIRLSSLLIGAISFCPMPSAFCFSGSVCLLEDGHWKLAELTAAAAKLTRGSR